MSLRLPLNQTDIGLGSEGRRILLAQASAQHLRGELNVAEAQYLRLHAAAPADTDVLFLLGTLYLQRGAPAAAIAHLSHLTEIQPKHEAALFHLALAHLENQTPASAEHILQTLLKHNARHQGALMALAQLCFGQARYEEVEPYFALACEYYPELTAAYQGLGKLYFLQRRYAEAQNRLARASQINPLDANILCDLGVVLRKQNLPAEAERCLRESIALEPQNADAHFNLADVLLYQGKFEQGWKEYEWRFRIQDRAPIFHDQPLWRGESLAGKTILIHAEQGYGDTFQFLRYLLPLKRQGARILFECQTGLRRVLRACTYIDQIIERTPTLAIPSDYDVYAPLLSLPGIMQTRFESIPREIGYVRVEPAMHQRWQARLAIDPKFKIGIVWSGKPSHADNPNRYCALTHFSAIADLPGVSLYSLQQGPAATEFQTMPWASMLTDLHDEISDFADTAAAISAMDLVISVDTSVAHLAGALGKTVWVLLSNSPDWRWLTTGTDCPWYPNMRLFRQTQAGDWQTPIAGMCEQLPAWVAKPRALIGALPYINDAYSAALLTSLHRARLVLRQKCETGQVDANELAQARYELEAVLCSAPPHAEANCLLAEILLLQENYAVAWIAAMRAYERWPEHPPLLKLIGQIAYAQAEYAEAVRFFERALNLGKEDGATWQALGASCLGMGLHAEALRAYRRAWEWCPNSAELCDKLGQLLINAGHLNEALGFFQRALEADGRFFPAFFHFGNALVSCGRAKEGETHLKAAIALEPNYAPALNNLGVALKAQQRFGEAEAVFRRAIQLDPGYSEAFNNLGNVLQQMARLEDAQAAFREALLHDATNAQAYNNLGIVLQAQGAQVAAMQCYEAAILLRANFAEAHWNLALARLAQGQWQAGFAGYEWGFEAGIRWRLNLGSRQWAGETALDKTLLVYAEQGFGDTLQFVRFLAGAKARVGQLICCVQRPLHSLLEQSLIRLGWADQVINDSANLPQHDLSCALLSLPHLLGVNEISMAAPYVFAPAEREAVFPARLAQTAQDVFPRGVLKVGLVWAGLATHQRDQQRSLPVSAYLPLMCAPDVRFYSLQVGAAAKLPPGLLDLAPQLTDFAATAAVLSELDLVITVDTAVAHLAGAMGVPTWVLLAHAPDWRWAFEAEKSDWYPSVRLFRQTRAGDWQTPMTQVLAALDALRARFERR